MADKDPKTWKILFYQDSKGQRPVQAFLDSLSKTARAAVLRDLALLKEFGVKLGAPTVKPITSIRKLWELRAATGRRFVLLHGFIKKSDKTPKTKLEIATKRLAEVLAQEK